MLSKMRGMTSSLWRHELATDTYGLITQRRPVGKLISHQMLPRGSASANVSQPPTRVDVQPSMEDTKMQLKAHRRRGVRPFRCNTQYCISY